jgi:hypothetical protein
MDKFKLLNRVTRGEFMFEKPTLMEIVEKANLFKDENEALAFVEKEVAKYDPGDILFEFAPGHFPEDRTVYLVPGIVRGNAGRYKLPAIVRDTISISNYAEQVFVFRTKDGFLKEYIERGGVTSIFAFSVPKDFVTTEWPRDSARILTAIDYRALLAKYQRAEKSQLPQ